MVINSNIIITDLSSHDEVKHEDIIFQGSQAPVDQPGWVTEDTYPNNSTRSAVLPDVAPSSGDENKSSHKHSSKKNSLCLTVTLNRTVCHIIMLYSDELGMYWKYLVTSFN